MGNKALTLQINTLSVSNMKIDEVMLQVACLRLYVFVRRIIVQLSSCINSVAVTLLYENYHFGIDERDRDTNISIEIDVIGVIVHICCIFCGKLEFLKIVLYYVKYDLTKFQLYSILILIFMFSYVFI